jgi:hypothetical protein
LLRRFKKDRLFDSYSLNDPNFGPGSQFLSVFIKSGDDEIKMMSWHELIDARDDRVATGSGVKFLKDGGRWSELHMESDEQHVFFRLIWAETRTKLTDLIPEKSSPTFGRPYVKDGLLYWREPSSRNQSIQPPPSCSRSEGRPYSQAAFQHQPGKRGQHTKPITESEAITIAEGYLKSMNYLTSRYRPQRATDTPRHKVEVDFTDKGEWEVEFISLPLTPGGFTTFVLAKDGYLLRIEPGE